jgi:DNA-3-methyladenine glycosylase
MTRPRTRSKVAGKVRFGRARFETDPETLARRLLGAHLVRVMPDGAVIRLRINETEAYLGIADRAAHSFGGRRTARTEPMYAAAGTSYVYFTYGMHYCFNIVAGAVNEPVAVLIRGGEVIEGLRAALANRRWTAEQYKARGRLLANGPAKLCAALAIDRSLNAIDLTSDPRLFVERGESAAVQDDHVIRTPRIGIDYAGEWVKRPLRFVVRKADVKLGKPIAESVGKVARARR